ARVERRRPPPGEPVRARPGGEGRARRARPRGPARAARHPIRGMIAAANAASLGIVSRDGWPALVASAVHQPRNAVVAVDGDRQIVDANPAFARMLGRSPHTLVRHRIFEFVAGGPLATPHEWHATIRRHRFAGEAVLVAADGGHIAVHWGATTEVVT